MYSSGQSEATPEDIDKFDKFEAWLRENGACFEQLELRSYECGIPQQLATTTAATFPKTGDDAAIAEEKKETSNVFPSGSSSSSSTMNCTKAAVIVETNRPMPEESEMRGVHAVNFIPANSVCMSIPRRCLITVEMGQATEIGQAVAQSDLELDAPKHIFLMLYVLWDRKVNGAASFFHPYYEILPRTLHNMPVFWTDTELAELQGSYLLHQISDRNQAIAEDYQAILSIAPSLGQICTLDEFKWARMCVCSRNFGLQIDGHRTSALVPHADMLNHYRPRETKWTFDEERQDFTITTLQGIDAGCEVLDSYGQKCNHRFLLNYGFAIENNREIDGFCPNEVPIELSVSTSDRCFTEKMEFWTRGELHNHVATTQSTSVSSDNHARVVSAELSAANTMKRVRVCASNNENTRLLFSLLRTLACTVEEIRAVSRPGNYQVSLSPYKAYDTTGLSSARGSLFSSSTSGRQSSISFPQCVAPAVVLTGSPAPAGATYHRSCRDIRHPLSLRNEQEAMRILLFTVQNLFSRYPTTLQQDMEALQNEATYPKFSNQRHARIQVRGEKQVLDHFLTWATIALQVLDVIEAELKEEGGINECSGAVEVQWRKHLSKCNNNSSSIGSSPESKSYVYSNGRDNDSATSFDSVIRSLEEEYEDEGPIHHTIVRYCADVLGSLRREEFRNLRRLQLRKKNINRNCGIDRKNY